MIAVLTHPPVHLIVVHAIKPVLLITFVGKDDARCVHKKTMFAKMLVVPNPLPAVPKAALTCKPIPNIVELVARHASTTSSVVAVAARVF